MIKQSNSFLQKTNAVNLKPGRNLAVLELWGIFVQTLSLEIWPDKISHVLVNLLNAYAEFFKIIRNNGFPIVDRIFYLICEMKLR